MAQCNRMRLAKLIPTVNNRGKISKFQTITRKFLETYYGECHPRESRNLSLELIRYIASKRKFERKTLQFVREIRQKILCLHEFNLQIAKAKFKYPLTKQFYDLLIRYVEIECECLYGHKKQVEEHLEQKVRQRVLGLVQIILYDALLNEELSMKQNIINSKKAVLNLFVHVRADCAQENKLVRNVIIKLLEYLGAIEQVNQLKGENIPFPEDTLLENSLVSDVRNSLVYDIFNYDTDFGSDDETESKSQFLKLLKLDNFEIEKKQSMDVNRRSSSENLEETENIASNINNISNEKDNEVTTLFISNVSNSNNKNNVIETNPISIESNKLLDEEVPNVTNTTPIEKNVEIECTSVSNIVTIEISDDEDDLQEAHRRKESVDNIELIDIKVETEEHDETSCNSPSLSIKNQDDEIQSDLNNLKLINNDDLSNTSELTAIESEKQNEAQDVGVIQLISQNDDGGKVLHPEILAPEEINVPNSFESSVEKCCENDVDFLNAINTNETFVGSTYLEMCNKNRFEQQSCKNNDVIREKLFEGNVGVPQHVPTAEACEAIESLEGSSSFKQTTENNTIQFLEGIHIDRENSKNNENLINNKVDNVVETSEVIAVKENAVEDVSNADGTCLDLLKEKIDFKAQSELEISDKEIQIENNQTECLEIIVEDNSFELPPMNNATVNMKTDLQENDVIENENNCNLKKLQSIKCNVAEECLETESEIPGAITTDCFENIENKETNPNLDENVMKEVEIVAESSEKVQPETSSSIESINDNLETVIEPGFEPKSPDETALNKEMNPIIIVDENECNRSTKLQSITGDLSVTCFDSENEISATITPDCSENIVEDEIELKSIEQPDILAVDKESNSSLDKNVIKENVLSVDKSFTDLSEKRLQPESLITVETITDHSETVIEYELDTNDFNLSMMDVSALAKETNTNVNENIIIVKENEQLFSDNVRKKCFVTKSDCLQNIIEGELEPQKCIELPPMDIDEETNANFVLETECSSSAICNHTTDYLENELPAVNLEISQNVKHNLIKHNKLNEEDHQAKSNFIITKKRKEEDVMCFEPLANDLLNNHKRLKISDNLNDSIQIDNQKEVDNKFSNESMTKTYKIDHQLTIFDNDTLDDNLEFIKNSNYVDESSGCMDFKDESPFDSLFKIDSHKNKSKVPECVVLKVNKLEGVCNNKIEETVNSHTLNLPESEDKPVKTKAQVKSYDNKSREQYTRKLRKFSGDSESELNDKSKAFQSQAKFHVDSDHNMLDLPSKCLNNLKVVLKRTELTNHEWKDEKNYLFDNPISKLKGEENKEVNATASIDDLLSRKESPNAIPTKNLSIVITDCNAKISKGDKKTHVSKDKECKQLPESTKKEEPLEKLNRQNDNSNEKSSKSELKNPSEHSSSKDKKSDHHSHHHKKSRHRDRRSRSSSKSSIDEKKSYSSSNSSGSESKRHKSSSDEDKMLTQKLESSSKKLSEQKIRDGDRSKTSASFRVSIKLPIKDSLDKKPSRVKDDASTENSCNLKLGLINLPERKKLIEKKKEVSPRSEAKPVPNPCTKQESKKNNLEKLKQSPKKRKHKSDDNNDASYYGELFAPDKIRVELKKVPKETQIVNKKLRETTKKHVVQEKSHIKKTRTSSTEEKQSIVNTNKQSMDFKIAKIFLENQTQVSVSNSESKALKKNHINVKDSATDIVIGESHSSDKKEDRCKLKDITPSKIDEYLYSGNQNLENKKKEIDSIEVEPLEKPEEVQNMLKQLNQLLNEPSKEKTTMELNIDTSSMDTEEDPTEEERNNLDYGIKYAYTELCSLRSKEDSSSQQQNLMHESSSTNTSNEVAKQSTPMADPHNQYNKCKDNLQQTQKLLTETLCSSSSVASNNEQNVAETGTNTLNEEAKQSIPMTDPHNQYNKSTETCTNNCKDNLQQTQQSSTQTLCSSSSVASNNEQNVTKNGTTPKTGKPSRKSHRNTKRTLNVEEESFFKRTNSRTPVQARIVKPVSQQRPGRSKSITEDNEIFGFPEKML